MRPNSFWLTKILNIIVSIVQILIGLYIVLKMFGAALVPFVRWVYAINSPLLSPFQGIFDPVRFMNDYILDLSAVFALIIYSAVGYLLIKLAAMIESR
jgi:uncharacterized protein YggT (Ycf19 family)